GGFPHNQWAENLARLAAYWKWFTGDLFAEETTQAKDAKPGEKTYKYPLQINTVRTYSRIQSAMLFGETGDDYQPLITMRAQPIADFMEDSPSEEEKKQSRFYERVLNHIWEQSSRRAILREGGTVSQYLGGYYYQATYVPHRPDLPIPVLHLGLKPDCV